MQQEALSKDGTVIPYFLIHNKNMKLDGSNPTLLYGYGGFGKCVLAAFSMKNSIRILSHL
jgi:prolyl oligopeptidase